MGPISTNVADARVAGTEIQAQHAWTDLFTTGLSYTYNDSQDLQTDKLLPLRPPHIARVWGQKKLAALPLTLWAETIVRSGTWNDQANTLHVGESIKLNAALRYAVTQQLELYIRGENLTNNRTQQFYSADTPGIAVYGGFQTAF